MRLIDADKLYEKAADVESEALDMLNKIMNERDVRAWATWSAIQAERAAFKFDVADAPTVDAIPVSFLEGLQYDARHAEVADSISEILRLWDEEAKGWN